MKKEITRWKKILTLSLVLLSLSAQTAVAAEPGAVFSMDTQDETIILYVQDPGEAYSVSCQIGNVSCEQINSQPISGQEIPVKTTLLLDNSLSVSPNYRPLILEILDALVANRMEGETFTIAVFSDKLTYLQQDCSDYVQLKQTIDGITYEDQETYLTDVLYDLLMEQNKAEDTALRRFVIVSDGVDNKSIGYTKEELYDLLKVHPYPIYTLGCTYKGRNGDNSEALKNMFALSRQTQGASWLLDEVKDPMDVALGVAESNELLRVVVTPPPALCDGSSKGVKLTFESGGQFYSSSVVMDMPFGTAVPEAAQTTAEEETEKMPAAEETVAAAGGHNKKAGLYMILTAAAVLVAVVILVILIRIFRKREKEERFEAAPPETEDFAVSDRDPGDAAVHTEALRACEEELTTYVWGNESALHVLILSDQTNPARSFEVPLKEKIVIGRSKKDCQIVLDYDKSVSGRHCEIFVKNERFFVKDLNSTNMTFLNGIQVLTETELYSGCSLTLGRLKMKVEIH